MRLITFCICILCGAGIVGGLGAASHVQRFAVKDISVSGAHSLSPQSLTASVQSSLQGNFAHLFAKKNMFLYPQRAIESSLLESYPRIKNVSLARASLFAQAVVVSVEERQPFALWCDEQSTCFLLDSKGFIFAESDGTLAPDAYVFRGGLLPNRLAVGQSFLPGHLDSVLKFMSELKNSGYPAKGLTVENEKDFSIELQHGPTLVVSFDQDISEVIRDMQAAIDSDALKGKLETVEYIDLRFGNKVYYKFKNAQTESGE